MSTDLKLVAVGAPNICIGARTCFDRHYRANSQRQNRDDRVGDKITQEHSPQFLPRPFRNPGNPVLPSLKELRQQQRALRKQIQREKQSEETSVRELLRLWQLIFHPACARTVVTASKQVPRMLELHERERAGSQWKLPSWYSCFGVWSDLSEFPQFCRCNGVSSVEKALLPLLSLLLALIQSHIL